ncbi:glycoside hydrolase [Chytriomyces sp. MP71]|nr:glycoside hydrolase [Chytriomyces sp. MP71]
MVRKRRGSHDPAIPHAPRLFLVNVDATKNSLLKQEDTDNDGQITIRDTGPKAFVIPTANSAGFNKFEVRGTYALANLLQELQLASDHARKFIILSEDRVFENPLDRLTRLIKFHFWDGLTRRIDAQGLEAICVDIKNKQRDTRNRIYVPFHDVRGLEYFSRVSIARPHLDLEVVRLPEVITPLYVKGINSAPGILALGLRQIDEDKGWDDLDNICGTPFVVPGGRFNEQYGWDSYFESLGLIVDGRIGLAQGMLENFVYEIEHYGKILNANRSYYLTRSQPPFLTDMLRHVYAAFTVWEAGKLHAWLARALRAAVKELFSVWLTAPRLDLKVGLSKYFPEGIGIPPETEQSHFDVTLKPFAARLGIPVDVFEGMYARGEVQVPELDEYFVHDRAVRESGHDTTYRFDGKCANLATVDLNCLVFKYETDLNEFIANEFGGSEFTVTLPAILFAQLATRTRSLIHRHLWSDEDGMFMDFNCATMQRSGFETATTFWTLWARVATHEQADVLVPRCLRLFEVVGGVVATTERSRGALSEERPARQWDYPYGWAPHQMLAWKGLENYNRTHDARRLAYRWLYTCVKAFVDYNGVVPEKFDVVNMTHRVNVEYGNVGSDFKYVVREGFGWMNASCQVGLHYMTTQLRRSLGALVHPDKLFGPIIPLDEK